MDSKTNILITFFAACASLVVIFALPAVGPKHSKEGEKLTLSSHIEFNTNNLIEMKMSLENEENHIAKCKEKIDDEEGYYDDIEVMRADYVKMCDKFDENKLNFYKLMVMNFLAKLSIFVLIAILAMSAYLYGAYDNIEDRHLSFKILRFSALIPCVVFLIFMFVMKDWEFNRWYVKNDGYDSYVENQAYNLVPMIVPTAIVAIFGLMVKPKPQQE